MLFFYDTFDRSVEAFPNIQETAKHILSKLRVSVELGMDPVEQAKKSLGNRGKVVSYTGAFELISNSEDKFAQELAFKFKEALVRIRK